MSGLGFNKVAGALLATGLAVLGLREVSSIIYQQHPPERPGYRIEVAEAAEGGGAAAEEGPADWGTLLPAANTTTGASTSRRCTSCHTFENGGANGIGPNLWGVLGRAVGAVGGYDYSAALRTHAATAPSWTYDEMNAFLRAPQRHIPGTKMTFAGLRQQEDRVNLIAYLRTQSATQLPIPAPDPARAAGAAGPGDSAAVPSTGAGEAGATPAEENPAGEGSSAQGVTTTPAGAPQQPGGGLEGQAPTAGAAAAPTTVTNRNPGGDGGRR